MKIIIIEDEEAASKKLSKMLREINPDINILTVLESVKDSLRWLKNNAPPDAAFVDIQLSDDMSFEIFRQLETGFPVIFTTAYDDYILKSFEYNSIDYILKPITEERLEKALDKISKFEKHFFRNKISRLLEQNEPKYRERFIVKKGLEYISIETKDIAYFFSEHKLVFLKDKNANKYLVDKPLSELTSELDPIKFFRLNRQFLCEISAIKKYRTDSKGKIIAELEPPSGEEVIISKEIAPVFKKWINQL